MTEPSSDLSLKAVHALAIIAPGGPNLHAQPRPDAVRPSLQEKVIDARDVLACTIQRVRGQVSATARVSERKLPSLLANRVSVSLRAIPVGGKALYRPQQH